LTEQPAGIDDLSKIHEAKVAHGRRKAGEIHDIDAARLPETVSEHPARDRFYLVRVPAPLHRGT
jgi:hypothetical protein